MLITNHMPGCIRMKIGNRGIPFVDLPWNLNVTTLPFDGGLRLCASLKPDPILNSVPSFSRTIIAPHIVSHLPVPLSWPITVASASSNRFTFSRLKLLLCSYFELGSFIITPSPLPPQILSICSSKCSLLLQTVWLISLTVSFAVPISFSSYLRRLVKLPLSEGPSKTINLISFHFSGFGSCFLTVETIDWN